MDFDAGAKYHVPANTPYIRYFVAFVLEFEFYRDLCVLTGQFVPGSVDRPLHRCDYSVGPLAAAAGDKMRWVVHTH
jgi:peptidyl-dipeptidase A